jgi:hypothetical protein
MSPACMLATEVDGNDRGCKNPIATNDIWNRERCMKAIAPIVALRWRMGRAGTARAVGSLHDGTIAQIHWIPRRARHSSNTGDGESGASTE